MIPHWGSWGWREVARVQVKKTGSKILKSTIFELHKCYTPQKKAEDNRFSELNIWLFHWKMRKKNIFAIFDDKNTKNNGLDCKFLSFVLWGSPLESMLRHLCWDLAASLGIQISSLGSMQRYPGKEEEHRTFSTQKGTKFSSSLQTETALNSTVSGIPRSSSFALDFWQPRCRGHC